MIDDAQFSQFRKIAEPWLSCYDRISVSAIGVKDSNKRMILAGRLLLIPTVKPPFTVDPLEDSIFWGRADSFDIEEGDLAGILENLERGEINIGPLQMQLPKDHTNSSFSAWYTPSQIPTGANQYGPRWPTLQIRGGSRNVLLGRVVAAQELSWHMHAMQPPFPDFVDLHQHFGLGSPNQFGDATSIELIARAPVEIGSDSLIKNGRLHLTVDLVENGDKSGVSVGYRAVGGSEGIKRGVIASDMFEWTTTAPFHKGAADIPVADVPTVQCFLTYQGIGIQQLWIVDPQRLLNHRLAVHKAFDKDLGVLSRFLFEVTKKDKDVRVFEDGVAMLLGMLGFGVTQHGRSQRLSDAPDVIAITPAGHVAVVECTIGLPDQDDQIAKVLQRTEQIRKSLMGTGWPGVTVLPVIVTALAADEIKTHTQDALNKGVVVLCAEDLKRGLEQARYPSDPDRLFRQGLDRIQQKDFRLGS